MDLFAFVKKKPSRVSRDGLYSNMRQDNNWCSIYFLLSYETIIHDHSMIDTISVGLIECSECLRNDITRSCGYFYWSEFTRFFFNEYK